MPTELKIPAHNDHLQIPAMKECLSDINPYAIANIIGIQLDQEILRNKSRVQSKYTSAFDLRFFSELRSEFKNSLASYLKDVLELTNNKINCTQLILMKIILERYLMLNSLDDLTQNNAHLLCALSLYEACKMTWAPLSNEQLQKMTDCYPKETTQFKETFQQFLFRDNLIISSQEIEEEANSLLKKLPIKPTKPTSSP